MKKCVLLMHLSVMGAYLLITSLLATEIYARCVHPLLPTLPTRVNAFFICLPFFWLFIDNVVLGIGLAKSRKTVELNERRKKSVRFTDKDDASPLIIHLRRQLKSQEQRNTILERYLGQEMQIA